jgi:hypothetical protein
MKAERFTFPFVSFTRTAWGWCAATIYNDQRYHAQGDTKRGALAALRNVVLKAVAP